MSEQRIARTLAGQAAIAIENARLHEEAARARKEVEQLNKVLRGRLEFEMSDVALGLLGASAQETGPWQQRSLDFHGSVQNYRRVKRRLLEQMKPHGFAVVNADDATTKRFMTRTQRC